MTLISFVSDIVGTPANLAGEIILYTLSVYILLAVIEQCFGIFHALIKLFR